MKRVLGIVTGLSASVLLFGASTIGASPTQDLNTASVPAVVVVEPNLWNGISGIDPEVGLCDDNSDDIFEALILTSGWATRLDTSGSGTPRYTVFQPYDTILTGLLASLRLEISDLNSQPAVVQAILADHIANGSFDETELEDPDLTRITMRSGYVATVVGAPGGGANRTLYDNVFIAGSFIKAGGQFSNGWLYCITGFINSSPQVPHEGLNSIDTPNDGTPGNPLTLQWTSPPTPTSSRHHVFELEFAGVVAVVGPLTSSDFENLGTQQDCTMTPFGGNGDAPTLRYLLLVSCRGIGTVQPRLKSSSLLIQNNTGSNVSENLNDASGANTVDMVNGIVLTVQKIGSGQGQVSSNLSGVNCGPMCVGVFNRRTQINLTAAPVVGSIFMGWSGACTGTGICRVNLVTSSTVTARFEPAAKIALTKAGDGLGVVTSNPAVVNCTLTSSQTCSGWAAAGSQVTLQARANRGSRFVGWIGACSGTGSCSISAQYPGQVIYVFPIFERS